MVTRIDARVMVPGRGAPVPDATVVVDGPRITYAGPAAQAPQTPDADTVSVPAVMPGLWDCHAHLFGATSLDIAQAATQSVITNAAKATKDCEKALAAGFTSVREVGGYGLWLARAVDDGSVPGPHIYGAGAILSTTGGHGDIHAFPLPWIADLGIRDPSFRLCDGVPDCLRAVREQLREGAPVIKVCASGGVLSEVDHPLHQQFSDEELRAIVEEAARAERVVAAHCHGKAGILAALRAGCRTIEHGSHLDEECAQLMRDSDAILVPTRTIVAEMLAAGEASGAPEFALRKVRALADRHLEAMRIAVSTGVTVALGTDTATSDDSLPAHWGGNAAELVHLVEAGMSPLQAIEAGTATGPLTLGPQAPRSGMLAEGYDADILGLAADPSGDVGVLTDPANVLHVWKDGLRVLSARNH